MMLFSDVLSHVFFADELPTNITFFSMFNDFGNVKLRMVTLHMASFVRFSEGLSAFLALYVRICFGCGHFC